MAKPEHPYFTLPAAKSKEFIQYKGFDPAVAHPMMNFEWLDREAQAGRDPLHWAKQIMESEQSYPPYKIANTTQSFQSRAPVPGNLTGSSEVIDSAARFGVLTKFFEYRSGQYKRERSHPVIWNTLCTYRANVTDDDPAASWSLFAAYMMLQPDRAM